MCYIPPSTKRVRPQEVQMPSMAGIKIPTLKLYRTRVLPPNATTSSAWPESQSRPAFSMQRVPNKINPPRLATTFIRPPVKTPSLSLDLPADIFRSPTVDSLNSAVSETYASSPSATSYDSDATRLKASLPLSGPFISLSGRGSSSSSPAAATSASPSSYAISPQSPLPFTPDEELGDEIVELDEELDPEDAWNLVPYHIPWGSLYHGYKAGTLPGPDGKCIFLRSPTPLKNQRTGQACEKCRERKAKCSGSRPSCARCIARGHPCEYGPEIKRPRAEDSVKEEDEDDEGVSLTESSTPSAVDTASRPIKAPPTRSRSNTDAVPRSTPVPVPIFASSSVSRRRSIETQIPTRPSPAKKRRPSARDHPDAFKPSASAVIPPSALGLFSSISPAADSDGDDQVFAHDTPSTSSEPSEPESYQSVSSLSQQVSFPAFPSDFNGTFKNLSQYHLPERIGGLSFPHIVSNADDSFFGGEIDMQLTEAFSFDYHPPRHVQLHAPNPLRYPATIPSISQTYQPPPAPDGDVFSFSTPEGYSTSVASSGESPDADFDFSSLSPAVSTQASLWHPASHPEVRMGGYRPNIPSDEILSNSGSFFPSSSSSDIAALLASMDDSDPSSLVLFDSVEVQGTSYDSLASAGWAVAGDDLQMTIAADHNTTPIVRGPAAYFDRHGNGNMGDLKQED